MAGTNYVQFEIQYASIVLIWYDWILMLPMEVKYIWGAKIRISTIIYILCHYALVANVLYLLAISKVLKQRLVNQSCDIWYKIIGCLSVLGRAAIIFSFVARSYAVWGRRRAVFLYLASIGIVCVGLDIASASTRLEMRGFLNYSNVFKERNRSRSEDPRRSFWDLTFEQGILYFCFMSVFTMASVVLNFRAPAGFYQRLLNAFTLPLSGLLTSRFILHLRKCEHELSVLGHVAVASTNSARAESILSTIFEPDFGWDPMVQVDDLERRGTENIQLVPVKNVVPPKELSGTADSLIRLQQTTDVSSGETITRRSKSIV